ncbi:rifin [Plasmodium falciparum NF54]|uniref:Rifin n=2 Tax=Plasmodium falciparum TaxID=5833 RepID=Q8IHM2_PLAF7|nr:rifin [Plasmodium falciparum 3D7]EWC87687.1 hypothetical protein PFNF54_03535 [Plasmodium falciparum NF54]KAF4328915.1 rifin [Plasmodium falciparum NF54]PKC46709.1 rifin [Plasmodium falciparum NF54]CZT99160.1 rifin [Plasmodium falciparum 3D7]|eukprot:XP_001348174.1 rifin [Plasmodium falciparum 3D7]
MKVYYINILLFAFPLNILVYNQWNHKSTTHHTPKVPTTRLLYECELYIPNYDNDPEMKRIMQQFDDRTSQRFHEYDNRMIEKQQKCKDQCDKEIQKIILKDKLEKELMEKFATLQTDIQNDAIPTCVCEKSLADKTEKFCLNCGKTMGAVAPAWGLISCIGYVGWSQYVAAKIVEAGIKNGLEVGLLKVTEAATSMSQLTASDIPKITIEKMLSSGTFTDKMTFSDICNYINTIMSSELESKGYTKYTFALENIAKPSKIKYHYSKQSADVLAAITEGKTAESLKLSPYTSILTNTIIASIIAIVVIVLVMVIIYLILRYRRKKKMKKKLEYMKLLKE